MCQSVDIINPRRMHSEGYNCLCVCVYGPASTVQVCTVVKRYEQILYDTLQEQNVGRSTKRFFPE